MTFQNYVYYFTIYLNQENSLRTLYQSWNPENDSDDEDTKADQLSIATRSACRRLTDHTVSSAVRNEVIPRLHVFLKCGARI